MGGFPGGDLLQRGASMQATAESGVFEVAVSSEHVVVRDGGLGAWRELLDHGPGSVDMARFQSGAAAVLVDHSGDQVGVVESARLDPDRVLRARIRFSANPRGQEIQRDVQGGIRKNISVGYLPKASRLVEKNAELGDLWRVTAWEPLELSIVAVPADPTVGVGRSLSAAGASRPFVEVQVDTNAAAIAELAASHGMANRAAGWIRVDGRRDPRLSDPLSTRWSTPRG